MEDLIAFLILLITPALVFGFVLGGLIGVLASNIVLGEIDAMFVASASVFGAILGLILDVIRTRGSRHD